MSEGMKDEAYKTTHGLYHVIYEGKVLVRNTRGLGYHREFPGWNVHTPHSYLGPLNDAAESEINVDRPMK